MTGRGSISYSIRFISLCVEGENTEACSAHLSVLALNAKDISKIANSLDLHSSRVSDVFLPVRGPVVHQECAPD